MKTRFYHFSDSLSVYDAFVLAQTKNIIKTHAVNKIPPLLSTATRCEIRDDDGNFISEGFAFCSKNDQFSKRLGRRISEGRATKEIRRRWHDQFDQLMEK